MPVTSTTARWAYVGDGVTTVFPYDNLIFASSDLKVYEDGVLILAGYTVSGVGNPAGGNVTYAVAPAAGVDVVIVRDVPDTQTSDLPEGGSFPAATVEGMSNRRTVVSQQQAARIERSLRLADGDPDDFPSALPLLADLAGNLLGFDAGMNPVAVAGATTLPVSAFMATVLLAADAATAQTDLGASAIGASVFTAADAAAIRALIDVLSTGESFSTGDIKPTWKVTADPGWIMHDDGSIGDVGSGATTRANADTEALFTLWWDNYADTECPVSTGRGASAAADFAAGKTITMPQALGRTFGIAGAGSGLTARTRGSTVGEETHTTLTGEMPIHDHDALVYDGGAGGGYDRFASGQVSGASGRTDTTTIQNAGGDGAHNNMQPTVWGNAMIKL